MPREKTTLTLDGGNLRELRQLVGARSLSATVAFEERWQLKLDSAVLAYLRSSLCCARRVQENQRNLRR